MWFHFDLYALFRSVLFHSQIFGGYRDIFLLLISNLNLLGYKKNVYSDDFSPFTFIKPYFMVQCMSYLCECTMCSFYIILYILFKYVFCSCWMQYSVNVKSSWVRVLFRTSVFRDSCFNWFINWWVDFFFFFRWV